MAKEEKYRPGEKFEADMAPVFPQAAKIPCKDCQFRKPGQLGAANAYCEAYTADTGGKPNEILFDGAPCAYYRKAGE